MLNSAGQIVKSEDADHHLAGTPGMLRNGDEGPEVADLNASLKLLGYDVSGTKFTDATEAAVRKIQSSHPQLSVDGIAGPATRATINREADLRRKMATTVKTGGAGSIGTVAADVVSGGGVPVAVYVGAAVVLAIILGFFAWKYRDEIVSISKQ
jgi:lysozyme